MHTTQAVLLTSKQKGPPQGPLIGPWGVVVGRFDYESTPTQVRQSSTIKLVFGRHVRSLKFWFLNLLNELDKLK